MPGTQQTTLGLYVLILDKNVAVDDDQHSISKGRTHDEHVDTSVVNKEYIDEFLKSMCALSEEEEHSVRLNSRKKSGKICKITFISISP